MTGRETEIIRLYEDGTSKPCVTRKTDIGTTWSIDVPGEGVKIVRSRNDFILDESFGKDQWDVFERRCS